MQNSIHPREKEVGDHSLWTLLRYKATNFGIASWSGFQISISNGIPLLQTSIGYLDCIYSSAAEMSTIFQVN